MTVTRAWWPSQHYSAGGLSQVVIAFHTTEGSQTAESLRNWLTNPSSQVSYHFAVDMSHGDNWCANFVRTTDRAWAQASFNGKAISIAFCTPSGAASGWSRDTWLSKGAMLTAAGRLAGELAKQYGIPLTQLTSSQAQGSTKGVCEHKNFGAGGGNHTDCGNGFPMDHVLAIARGGAPSAPSTPTPATGGDMTAAVKTWGKNKDLYMACIGTDDRVYYAGPDTKGAWSMVDKNSSAKSGCGLDIDADGRVVIIYTNKAGKVCTYARPAGGGGFAWADRGGNAR